MHEVRFLVWLATIMVGSSGFAVYADDINHGETIYNGTCVACHGGDGAGSLPGVPDLTKKGGALNQSDMVLLNRMEEGFQSPDSTMAMPPRGGNPALTESDLKDVLKYMRREFQVAK